MVTLASWLPRWVLMRLKKETKAADALLEATAHERTAERTASEIRQSDCKLIERGEPETPVLGHAQTGTQPRLIYFARQALKEGGQSTSL